MSPARSQKPANLNEGQRRRGADGSHSTLVPIGASLAPLPLPRRGSLGGGCFLRLLGFASRLGMGRSSSLGLVAVDEGVDYSGDDGLLVVIEDVGSIGDIFQGGVIPFVLVEEELVGRDAQSHAKSPEHVKTGRRQPCLVAPQLGEMHPGNIGQFTLGKSTGGSQIAQSLGEFHQFCNIASSTIADHRSGKWRTSWGGTVLSTATRKSLDMATRNVPRAATISVARAAISM